MRRFIHSIEGVKGTQHSQAPPKLTHRLWRRISSNSTDAKGDEDSIVKSDISSSFTSDFSSATESYSALAVLNFTVDAHGLSKHFHFLKIVQPQNNRWIVSG